MPLNRQNAAEEDQTDTSTVGAMNREQDAHDDDEGDDGADCEDVEISDSGYDDVTSAEENGRDPVIDELNKASLAIQLSYIRDKGFPGGPVKKKITKKVN